MARPPQDSSLGRRSSWIARDRLLARLSTAAPRLTVLTGPPGAGKSVLAQQWLDEWSPTSVLLTLDAGDRHPSRLAGRLVVPATLPALLVLDGVDVVEGSPSFGLVEDLVRHAPPELHLCLCSRSHLDLDGTDGSDDVMVLGAEDLAFTLDEARRFLAARPGVAVTARHVEVVHAQTEGWAAALELTAAALDGRRGSEVDTYVARAVGTDRRVVHLFKEVMDDLDGETQEFLLHTSVLDRLTPALCDAVADRPGSAALLRSLHRANRFVRPVRDGEYRYHSLFAAFLRRRLQVRHPGEEAERHARAAAWFVDAGDPDAAVEHLLAAQRPDEALDMVVRHLPELIRAHRPQVAQRWMRGFPPAFAVRRPEYAVIDTLVGLGTGNSVSLRPGRGTVLAHRSPELAPLIDAAVAVSLAASGDPRPALERGERARRARRNGDRPALDAAAGDLWAHLPVALARAAALLEDGDEVQRWVDAFTREGSNRPEDEVALLGARAWCLVQHARLREAEALARSALAAAAAHGRRLVGATVDARLVLGVVARQRDWRQEAERALDEAVEIGVIRGQPGPVALAQLELAQMASSLGAHDDAIGLVVGVARRPHGWPLPPFVRGAIDEVDARIHLAAGDLDRAEALVDRLDPGAGRSLLEARVLARRGAVGRSLALIDAVHGDPTLNLRLRLEGEILAGRLEQERGDPQAARAHLVAAAAVTAREGHVRLYLDEGLDVPAPKSVPVGPAGGAEGSHLSDREYQVLRHLIGRLDNREISEAMYVSVNTVKTHLQSIYRKLGVESRREAVERARDIGIL